MVWARDWTPERQARHTAAWEARQAARDKKAKAERKAKEKARAARFEFLDRAQKERDRARGAAGQRKEAWMNDPSVPLTDEEHKWAEQDMRRAARERADSERRRARKLSAEPQWLTGAQREAMAEIFRDAARQGKHVDHIVPLRGTAVCGLHVPWNFQLLTPAENWSKGNRMPDPGTAGAPRPSIYESFRHRREAV